MWELGDTMITGKKNLTEAIRMDYFFENGEKSMVFHLA